LIDSSVLLHRAILGWSAMKKLQAEGKMKKDAFINPSHYTYFQILIGLLKRVGVDKEDDVYLILDGRNSWRKTFFPAYKGQRREAREKNKFVDWEYHWKKVNEVIEQIDKATNFKIVFINKIWSWVDLIQTPEGEKLLDENNIIDWSETYSPESDDVIASICLNNKDKECIIISSDADLQMLLVMSHVRFFTVMQKYQQKRGMYKVGINGFKILDQKIKKGDVGDNILISKNDTEKDKEIRKVIIDLINLPQWVQNPINEYISKLPTKENNFELLPFPSSLGKRFIDIYKKENVLTYEKCVQIEEKKKLKKKDKKKVDTSL
jgi:5'-3' exonuclease